MVDKGTGDMTLAIARYNRPPMDRPRPSRTRLHPGKQGISIDG